MAEELRCVAASTDDDAPALAHALTRLVVLPFRVLRPDPETDFLAFSLPDAIATSLSGIGSLIVRSSAVAARFAGDAPDLKALAAEADVDRVVMGTLLRSGDQLRATAQLVEAPGGTLLTSHTVQASLGDLFRLQDDIARRVVEALSLPLTGARRHAHARRAAQRAAPTSSTCARTSWRAPTTGSRRRARSLRAVPRARSAFAPAWAQLGRCHRVIGKFIDGSPDSETRAPRRPSAARSSSTRACRWRTSSTRNLEADIGQSPERAMVRLLERGQRGTATIRSCSPASSTPAATAGSSRSRSPRAEARGSIRTSSGSSASVWPAAAMRRAAR